MKLHIGQILVADGVLADDAVLRALDFQRRSTEAFRLGSILIGWDLLGEEALLAGLEKLHRCASITWEKLALAKMDAIRSFRAIARSGWERFPSRSSRAGSASRSAIPPTS